VAKAPRKGGPQSADPVWVVFPEAAQRRALRALWALKKLPKSRQFGTSAGRSMARAMASGRAVDARKVTHFFPRWRSRIQELEALGRTPMDDKVIGASDLWGGSPGDRFATRAVERAEKARESKGGGRARRITYIG